MSRTGVVRQLVGLPATELAARVRSGELSAVEVVRAHLAHIDAVEARIGAYRVLRHDAALAEAAEVDARPDRARLPLAGVPVAVKDNVAVAGETATDGTAAAPAVVAPADHPVVARLRAAGAVVVGITRVPELCVFAATDGPGTVTRNPWDTALSPAGSSGGSAAAVASGGVPLAHGNDGMGSLRLPAAACGLVTLKPGTGWCRRVSAPTPGRAWPRTAPWPPRWPTWRWRTRCSPTAWSPSPSTTTEPRW
ncbi:amidase family protein [Klenkia terrae]|uniref:amidase family protein n=1 Tax=Klenkia terrae TaxID=1052259 RepID=UPI00360C6F4F